MPSSQKLSSHIACQPPLPVTSRRGPARFSQHHISDRGSWVSRKGHSRQKGDSEKCHPALPSVRIHEKLLYLQTENILPQAPVCSSVYLFIQQKLSRHQPGSRLGPRVNRIRTHKIKMYIQPTEIGWRYTYAYVKFSYLCLWDVKYPMNNLKITRIRFQNALGDFIFNTCISQVLFQSIWYYIVIQMSLDSETSSTFPENIWVWGS